jgi:hypothetical protein
MAVYTGACPSISPFLARAEVGHVGSVDVDTQYGYTNFDSTTRQLFEQACVDLYQVAHLSETVNNA